MKFVYMCEGCSAEITVNETVGDKPVDWTPEDVIKCDNCGGNATRIFGCDIGIDNARDTIKVGESLSNTSNVQFVGKGFADVDRRLESETQEIERLMAEPATAYDIEAGKQQAEELEREKGKVKGSISGHRETENVKIRAVSEDEAEKRRIDQAQKFSKQLENEIVVGPDQIEEVSKKLGIQPLKVGEEVTKTMQKRRGKNVLAEEARKNRLSR